MGAEDYEYVDYNVWQPFDHEVVQNPIALLDGRTLDPAKDLWPFFTPYDAENSETIVSASPQHRWFYFSRMRPDEVLLFMGHKHPSSPGSYPGGAGFGVPHASFWDPSVHAG